MTNLQPRKIPVLTGINDIPSTTGQPNHPNASLLCKNYNDLIDDVQAELIDVKGQITSLQANNVSTGTSSVITIPSFVSTPPRINEVYDIELDSINPSFSLQLTYERPLSASWGLFSSVRENNSQQIELIDGIEQTEGDITYLVTTSGDNLEFLTIDFSMNNLNENFLILPILLKIQVDNPYAEHRVLIRVNNYTRVLQGTYDWNQEGSSGGGS